MTRNEEHFIIPEELDPDIVQMIDHDDRKQFLEKEN